MNSSQPLAELSEVCRTLGAEVRYHPEQRYLTAMVWAESVQISNEGAAHMVQQQIQEKTAQYPGLVCYCFDAFSTLVYAV